MNWSNPGNPPTLVILPKFDWPKIVRGPPKLSWSKPMRVPKLMISNRRVNLASPASSVSLSNETSQLMYRGVRASEFVSSVLPKVYEGVFWSADGSR